MLITKSYLPYFLPTFSRVTRDELQPVGDPHQTGTLSRRAAGKPEEAKVAKRNGHTHGPSPPSLPSASLQGLGWAECNPRQEYREVRVESWDDGCFASAEPGKGAGELLTEVFI